MTQLLFALIALLAGLARGASGVGSAMILVGLGSMVLPARDAVLVDSLVNIVGTGMLLVLQLQRTPWRFALPLIGAVTLGSIAGGLLFSVLDVSVYERLLGLALLAGGGVLWMQQRFSTREHAHDLPARCSLTDGLASAGAGLCGGLFGVAGMPLALYFSLHFAKDAFRRAVVPVLFAAAVSRCGVYALDGQFTLEHGRLLAVTAPAILAGVWLGDRIFRRLPETAFRRIIGAIIVLTGLRLLG